MVKRPLEKMLGEVEASASSPFQSILSGRLTTVAEPMSEARLERAVTAAAYAVARYGPVYGPIFERLEQELVELRARRDPVERARRYLAQHAVPVGNAATLVRPAA